MDLKIGDVVEHAILGKRKVIVGIDRNKYLCVDEDDLTSEGKVKENSRISTHSGNNFYVMRNIANVQAINAKRLFSKKKVTADFRPSKRIEFILIVVILSVFTIIILATFTSLIWNMRRGVENLLVKKAESIKEQIQSEVKTEAIKKVK